MSDRVYLFDTTLRDGGQTQGVDFSVSDKVTIAKALDALKVDYIEGGWPGGNPTDDAFFAEAPTLSHSRLTAFGMTRRAGRSADNDPGLAALLSTQARVVCMVGKCWDFHVDVALGINRAENLAMIRDSVAHAKKRVDEIVFDAEHFFDGYKANKDYALDCIKAADQAGARWIVLCDTNGGTLPHEIKRIVSEVAKLVPGERLGIHAHDDTGNAVANSLAAVEAGARQVHGTLNGLGERCGNANLVTLIPTLMLKYDGRYTLGLGPEDLRHLTHSARLLDELLNRAPDRNAPYVGESAFAHKGGLHVSAVLKDPASYEHVAPEAVGNRRHIVVSDQGGRANLMARLAEIGIDIDVSDPKVRKLVDAVKQREFEGYAYDGAEASFELLARRALGQVPEFFHMQSFRVEVERRRNAKGELVTMSQAVVKLAVGDNSTLQVAEGNGPINALDAALRKALIPHFPQLDTVRLVDFKVRILSPQQATAAVTRVMIEHADEGGQRWWTVGISANIIDAAYEAMHDGIVYKLLRDKPRP